MEVWKSFCHFFKCNFCCCSSQFGTSSQTAQILQGPARPAWSPESYRETAPCISEPRVLTRQTHAAGRSAWTLWGFPQRQSFVPLQCCLLLMRLSPIINQLVSLCNAPALSFSDGSLIGWAQREDKRPTTATTQGKGVSQVVKAYVFGAGPGF